MDCNSPCNKRLFSLFVFIWIVQSALSQDNSQDWGSRCKQRVLDALQSNANGSSTSPAPELVGEYGARLPNLTPDDAWGITVDSCFDTCSDITSTFEFADFSASFTNWLLPWLALIAQLPFETNGPFEDLMSILLAVGSPALITYSLCVTIFNRARIAEKFRQLKEDAKNSCIKDVYHHMIDRLDIACYVLQESQQTPMRAWEGNGWLSSLIILDQNQPWWESVRKSLASTRRGVTTSLIAQNLFAIIAWVFTIAAAFSSLGDPTTALAISSSSIWLWMIPVIVGWVAVGCQSDKGTVADALLGSQAKCYRAQNGHPCDSGIQPAEPGLQDGIRAVSGILGFNSHHSPRRNIPRAPCDIENGMQSPDVRTASSSEDQPTSPGTAMGEKVSNVSQRDKMPYFKLTRTPTALHPSSAVSHSPSIWSVALTGHESEEGPIYNYARVFTGERFAETVISGFENALRKIEAGESPSGRWRERDENGVRVDVLDNLAGTASQYHSFCDFDSNPDILENYPSWGAIPKKVWRHIIVASLMALFVQFGTTGPSLLIGVLTPTAGLGCRSGSYVLYGCLATASFVLLAGASFASHGLMLRHQRGRPFGIVLPVLFVTSKTLGSSLGAINAIWLILSSVFELAGIFDTCFCESDYIGLRQNGWVLLFKGAEELGPEAQNLWVGSIAFGAAVCVLSCTFVWLGTKDKS